MILVDSSVWIDHLRSVDPVLAGLLNAGRVLAHPFVTGEVALGSLRQREIVIGDLLGLPQAITASDQEVLQFIDRERLYSLGLGYIDTHLLAAVRLTPGASLWTRDKRLRAVASRLALAAKVVE